MAAPAITDIDRRRNIELSKLLLDQKNPRFGGLEGKSVGQADILDHIVGTFGVDDVLSSLAVNGYFDAEPVVCREHSDGNYVVVEGNRRLSACLILAQDTRASRQNTKARHYIPIWEAHGRPSINPLPCIVFAANQQQALLSYLGIRHISPAQAWDSYAKAAWVAEVVQSSDLSLGDVALMIGDQHNTIARLLEGYYLVKQLKEERAFIPENSIRKGRGSISAYPFSWVYTILGYSAVRRYLELGDDSRAYPPLKPENVPRAALVLNSMFGDGSRGKDAAIGDSREIGSLAAAFSSAEKITMLENGKSLEEIERQTQPLEERVRRGLQQVRDLQADISGAMNESQLGSEMAYSLVPTAKTNRTAAANIERALLAATAPPDED